MFDKYSLMDLNFHNFIDYLPYEKLFSRCYGNIGGLKCSLCSEGTCHPVGEISSIIHSFSHSFDIY